MAGGELTADEKSRINAAIAEAEVDTGLEFCVIVHSNEEEDARAQAERVFHRLGLHDRPSVMIVVVPHERTLEVVTAADVASRLSNDDCDAAVETMTIRFGLGDVVGGVEAGVKELAERAGPRPNGSAGHPHGEDIPNVVDLDDEPEL